MPLLFARKRRRPPLPPRELQAPDAQPQLWSAPLPPNSGEAASIEAALQGVLDLGAARAALQRAAAQLDGHQTPAALSVSAEITRALAAIGDPSRLTNQIGLHPGRRG